MALPWLGAVIAGALVSVAESVVKRTVVALGVGAVTFAGVGSVMTQFRTFALERFGGLPGDVLSLLSMMSVGVALNIVFSAVMVRLTLKGLCASGNIKQMVFKGTSGSGPC